MRRDVVYNEVDGDDSSCMVEPGGAAGGRGGSADGNDSVRGAGYGGYDAAVAGDALTVDDRAAGDESRLCGVWESGPRWADLCMVWNRAVAADAAGGCCRHGCRACAVVAGVCAQPRDAADSRDCGERLHERSAECSDSSGGAAVFGTAGILAQTVDCGSAGVDLCDDASALCAEHAGEQLHLSADVDGFVAAVAMGGDRRAKGAVAGCWCAGVESADADDDGAGCDGRSDIFPADGSVCTGCG